MPKRPRELEKVESYLSRYPVVVIVGARQVGKILPQNHWNGLLMTGTI